MAIWECRVSFCKWAIGLWLVALMLEGPAFVAAGSVRSVGRAGNAGNDAQVSEICNSDMTTFLLPPFNNLSDMTCKPLWNTFVMKVSLIWTLYIINFLSWLMGLVCSSHFLWSLFIHICVKDQRNHFSEII